jgi:hypothetical protein
VSCCKLASEHAARLCKLHPRRGGRVVDGSGLENRHTRKGIGGSNPSLSARPFDSSGYPSFDPGGWRNVPVGTFATNVPVLAFMGAIPYLSCCMYNPFNPNKPRGLVAPGGQPVRGPKRPKCSGKIDANVCTMISQLCAKNGVGVGHPPVEGSPSVRQSAAH